MPVFTCYKGVCMCSCVRIDGFMVGLYEAGWAHNMCEQECYTT